MTKQNPEVAKRITKMIEEEILEKAKKKKVNRFNEPLQSQLGKIRELLSVPGHAYDVQPVFVEGQEDEEWEEEKNRRWQRYVRHES